MKKYYKLLYLFLLVDALLIAACLRCRAQDYKPREHERRVNPKWAHERYIDSPKIFIILPCQGCRIMGVHGTVIDGVAYTAAGHILMKGYLKNASIIEVK